MLREVVAYILFATTALAPLVMLVREIRARKGSRRGAHRPIHIADD